MIYFLNVLPTVWRMEAERPFKRYDGFWERRSFDYSGKLEQREVKRLRMYFGSRAHGLEVRGGERNNGGLFEEFGRQCRFVRLERPGVGIGDPEFCFGQPRIEMPAGHVRKALGIDIYNLGWGGAVIGT